jgi:hypothetical protein
MKTLVSLDAQGPKGERLDLFHFIPWDLRAQATETTQDVRLGCPPPGSLCRTTYLQRCRSRLMGKEPAGTDNTMSWLAIWRV